MRHHVRRHHHHLIGHADRRSPHSSCFRTELEIGRGVATKLWISPSLITWLQVVKISPTWLAIEFPHVQGLNWR